MRKIIILTVAIFMAFGTFGQILSPVYDVGRQTAETLISENVENCLGSTETYEIPIVFHILNIGDPINRDGRRISTTWKPINTQPFVTSNSAREQISTTIKNLNERFNNTWKPYWLVDKTAISLNTGIQFVLADRDPNGNPTTGIVRHNLSNNLNFAENGMVQESYNSNLTPNEATLKAATGWPAENYLNIWVVPEINNNGAGCGTKMFGTFPSSNPNPLDGIVIQNNRLGVGNFAMSNGDLGAGLTEAIGTYLGLYQTWYATASCVDANQESDCATQGDRCCDTPPTPRNCSGYCSTRCGSPDGEPSQNFYSDTLDVYPDTWNYMDDTGPYCKRRFTQDQVCRMRSTIQNVRTNLANQNLNFTPTHNLGVDIYLERTGFHKFDPIVTLENSGDFEESNFTVDISASNAANPTETYTYSYGSAELGNIKAGGVYNIKFPALQMKDIGEWSIVATVTQNDDEFATDNTETYTFTKGYDGSVQIVSNYKKAFWAFLQFDIYDVAADKIIMDGRKYWSNSFLNNQKVAAENYKFIGYRNGLYGEKAGNVTVYNATGVNEQWYVDNSWYLPSGEYILRFYKGNALQNAPEGSPGYQQVSQLNVNSCIDGCEFRVLTNGTDYIYDMDQDWLTYLQDENGNYPFSWSWEPGVSSTDNDFQFIDQIETSPYPLLHRFTVPESFVSTETCISGGATNGFCDNATNNDPAALANIDLSFSYVGIGEMEIEVFTDVAGYAEPKTINVKVSEDETFSNVVKDTIVDISFIYPKHNKRKPLTNVMFDNLQEGARYWVKIDEPGYPSTVIDTVINANACFDVDGNPITQFTTVDGYVHGLVSIGGYCWFTEQLKTGFYSDGTPINEITDNTEFSTSTTYDNWHSSFIDRRHISSDNPAYIEESEWVEGNVFYRDGFFYSYLAYDNFLDATAPSICPLPFRVASLWDYEELANAVGDNPHIKLNNTVEQSFSLYGGTFAGGAYGTNVYGWNGDMARAIIWTNSSSNFKQAIGREYGYGAAGAYKDIQHRRKWFFPGTMMRPSQETFPDYAESAYNSFPEQSKLFEATDRFRSVRCISGAEAPEVRIGNVQELQYLSYYEPNTETPNAVVEQCNFDPVANQSNDIFLRADECGVCGGEGIPESFCDCEGNIEDAIGICGGDCEFDENNDGICDIAQAASILDCNPIEYDGFTYTVVLIGDQCWFQDNLRTSAYNDGTPITTDLTASEWNSTDQGAWTYYDNNSANNSQYGKLYNWYAVNTGLLCPTGWSVPSDKEWRDLELGLLLPRSQLKSTGYRGTSTSSGTAIGPAGSSQFSGQYGGIRIDGDGSFKLLENTGYYWTSNSFFSTRSRNANSAWNRAIFTDNASIGRYRDTWQTSGSKGHGLSVRCIKDE